MDTIVLSTNDRNKDTAMISHDWLKVSSPEAQPNQGTDHDGDARNEPTGVLDTNDACADTVGQILNSALPLPTTEMAISESKTVTVSLPLADIIIDNSLQMRSSPHRTAYIKELKEKIREGRMSTPVTVFKDPTSGEWLLVDGFGRVLAYKELGLHEVPAEVHAGDRRAALRYALGANDSHGARRTHRDLNKAVTTALSDPEIGIWSDIAIAEICAVSDRFVAKLRKKITPPNGSGVAAGRVGRDGRTYPVAPGPGAASICMNPPADTTDSETLKPLMVTSTITSEGASVTEPPVVRAAVAQPLIETPVLAGSVEGETLPTVSSASTSSHASDINEGPVVEGKAVLGAPIKPPHALQGVADQTMKVAGKIASSTNALLGKSRRVLKALNDLPPNSLAPWRTVLTSQLCELSSLVDAVRRATGGTLEEHTTDQASLSTVD